MKSQERLAGSEQDAGDDYRPSDEDLGVGASDPVLDAAETRKHADELAAVMARPEVQAAVDALVARRVAELAGNAAPPADTAGVATVAQAIGEAIAREIARANMAVAAQQPGYVKPVPPEEMEARAAAYIEMNALIKQALDGQSHPQYLLTEDFHADDRLWAKGDTIVWRGAPNTEMEPQNAAAQAIFEQMLRWIGGGTVHIADQVAEAVRGFGKPPEMQILDDYDGGGTRSITEVYKNGSYVRLAERVDDAPRRAVGPRRIAGTVVPEGPAGAMGPMRQPAAGAQPQVGSVMPAEAPSAAQSF